MTFRRPSSLFVLMIGFGLLVSACAANEAETLRTELRDTSGIMLASQRVQNPPVIVAQATVEPVAPLPVPTQVPAVMSAMSAGNRSESAVVRIQEEGIVQVGILYNNAPMSSLNERGILTGYEADLARAIAEDWGVEAAFVQVTRQNATEMLLAGEIDLLMGAIPHNRDYEASLSFSQLYFPGGQFLLVKEESPYQSTADLNGHRVGLVQGTNSEYVLGQMLSDGTVSVQPVLYLTLDQAVGALGVGEVDALLADGVRLMPIRGRMEGVRFIKEPVHSAPFAIAFVRHDGALRYLLDRAIQRSFAAGTLSEMRRTWFPNALFTLDIPVWQGVDDDTRGLADFGPDLMLAAEPVLDRLRAGQQVRIAGVSTDTNLSGLNAQLNAFYRALADEMARRWGASVQPVPGDDGVGLVAAGQVDLALGVTPSWQGASNVAYSAPLISHGDRLMTPETTDIAGFNDLRGGGWVGVFASEPGAADTVNEWAASVNTAVNIYTIINDADAGYVMTVDQNVDVIFGDSLRLLAAVEAAPDLLALTERWYSTDYYGIAVSRNDPDFLGLVEVTLQDMYLDGTFASLWEMHVGIGDPMTFDVWPGPQGTFLGINTAR